MRIAIVGAGFEPGEADRAAARDGDLQARRDDRQLSRKSFIEGHERATAIDEKFADDCWKQIEGFGEYGFPESHAASFAQSRLRLGLDQMPLPRRVRGGAAQQPADGFLCDVAACARRAGAWRRGAAGRCELTRTGIARWRARLLPQGSLHPRHASMSGDILTTHALRLGFRQIDGFSEEWGKKIESVRGARLRLRPRSLAAHRPAAQGAEEARACRRLQFARPQPPRRAVGGEGAAAGRRQGQPAAVRARGDAGAGAGRASAADAAGRAGDRGLSPSAPVAEGASGVVPARRSRRARHRAARACCPTFMPGRRVTIGGLVLVRQRPGTGNAIFMTLGGRDRRSPTPSSGRASSRSIARW